MSVLGFRKERRGRRLFGRRRGGVRLGGGGERKGKGSGLKRRLLSSSYIEELKVSLARKRTIPTRTKLAVPLSSSIPGLLDAPQGTGQGAAAARRRGSSSFEASSQLSFQPSTFNLQPIESEQVLSEGPLRPDTPCADALNPQGESREEEAPLVALSPPAMSDAGCSTRVSLKEEREKEERGRVAAKV